MLFLFSHSTRPGFTNEDHKKVLEMWSKWKPPEGVEFKMHLYAPDGDVYGVFESDTAEAVYEAVAPWLVYLDFEVKPVIEVDAAIPLMEKAIAFREG